MDEGLTAEIKEIARDICIKELKPYIIDIKETVSKIQESEENKHKEIWLELKDAQKEVVWAKALTFIVSTILTGIIGIVFFLIKFR